MGRGKKRGGSAPASSRSARCKSGKSKSCWAEFRAEGSRHFPKGPSTVDGLFDWPTQIAEAMSPPMMSSIKQHLSDRVEAYTDYSGVDCPRWSFEKAEEALNVVGNFGLQDKRVVFTRACDKGELQKRVLVAVACAADAGQSCVFGDMFERMPEAGVAFVEQMQPLEWWSKEDKREAYADLRGWFMENRTWLYGGDPQAWCYVHEKQCPCFPRSALDACTQASSSSGLPSEGVEMEVKVAEPEPFRQPLRIELAGVTCKGWSSAGVQGREADPSELPHGFWLAERVYRAEASLEDVCMVECTPRYPCEQRLAGEGIERTHDFVYMRSGPEFQGWPDIRHRFAGALLNRLTVFWVGPRGDALFEDFARRFWRSIQMSGSSLLVEDEDARWAHYALMAGNIMPVEDLKAMPQWELLTHLGPPGLFQRFNEWKQHMAVKHFLQPGEDFMCDLDHHPGTKGTGSGREWPCMLTHGMICGMNDTGMRIATSLERFVAQGFHCHEKTCSKWSECALFPVLKKLQLTRPQLAQLSGNGMHLHAQAAWMCYVLGNCHRRDWHQGMGIRVDAKFVKEFEEELDEVIGSSANVGE